MELLERLCTLTDHVEYDANIDIKDDNIVVKLKRFETNVACDLAAASATNLPVTEFHPNFLTPLLQTQPVTLLAVRPTQLQRNFFVLCQWYLSDADWHEQSIRIQSILSILCASLFVM